MKLFLSKILIFFIAVIFVCACASTSKNTMPDEIIPQTKLQYRDHEIDAYKKAGYFQSSLLQQSYIQLIAPDVHYQLQELAN